MTGPQLKFAQGVAQGLCQADAYQAAYPRSNRKSASTNGGRLLRRDDIQEEIRRLRNLAETLPGSPLLTIREKREFLARIIRAKVGALADEGPDGPDADLWESVKITDRSSEYKLPSKLMALKADNDLAGDGEDAEKNSDALTELLARL